MRRNCLTIAAASLLAQAGAALAAPVPPVDEALLRDMVKSLAADDLAGRSPASAEEARTLDLIVARFKAAGLEPGNKGSWFQDVPTVSMTAKDFSALTIAGGATPLTFAHGTDFVAGSYRVNPKTAVKDSELVFVGYGINAPELGWNDYAGLDMKGKTAVILVNDPDYAMEGEDGLFRGRRMTYYGRWTYKFEEAARQGATGALIIHDTFPAAYGWNVVESSWTGEQHFVATPNDGADQTAFNGWIQNGVAQSLFKAAGKDLGAMVKAAGQKGFKPVPLGLKASLSFANAITRSTSRNVAGLQKGTTAPQEYVLYSAHWDHLGHCKADASGDDICNGAVDNATGVAALAALAEMNRKAGPTRRSQVYLAWTLEESGLLGSEYYARNPVFPLAQTVGGVNIDALSPGGPTHDIAVTGGDKSELAAILAKVAGDLRLKTGPEDAPEKGYYYRSDHFSLAKRGVPMFYVERGVDLVEGGTEAGKKAAEDYVVNRYHQPSDEYSADWDMRGIVQDVDLFYRLGRTLAEGSDWPNWNAGDEFRAIRDKSRAGK
ncbi:M28 family metallopeptidase [Novosphingobium sp. B1]|uniref:M28 family metallopeptidase n=1 Tax=Novosphingobium sp. B1 TaxID=1938756 RepID=UPI0009D8DFCB|nr:M28 family metallopeptidase [Novosphingobium sp. B1]SMC57297.1 Zn-dependent amino-or carboxypeptidase, M28 family [Novosphingobium sp. B1]